MNGGSGGALGAGGRQGGRVLLADGLRVADRALFAARREDGRRRGGGERADCAV